MDCILGVDGGNTKTIALVAGLDGLILGTGRSGCADIYGAVSPEAALAEIERAADSALSAAGVTRESVLSACFSLAGADWPEDYTFLHAHLEGCGFGRTVTIYNDGIGALRAGSPDGTGVVITSGTGAATAARNADGEFWHSSFWQDRGGGFDLGRQALRAVYDADLGINPPTSLTTLALAHFGASTVEALLRRFTMRDVDHPGVVEVSRLAPIVLREAEAGDATAREIVFNLSNRLADFALVAARKVRLERGSFPLILNGGIFRHPGHILIDTISASIQAEIPHVTPVRSRFEPAVGALMLAFENAGLTLSPERLSRLEASLPSSELYAS